jgi:hypothetical protein
MPAFDVALIELGHLLGLFKSGGDVDWEWFGDPVGSAFTALPTERERIGALVRALLDKGAPTGAFNSSANWEPVINTSNVGLGFAWSSSATPATDPLRIGLGAKASLSLGGQQVTLAALARLIRIAGQNVTPELGQAAFSGTFPVPDFLSAGELTGEVAPQAPDPVTLGLKAVDKQAQERLLEYPNQFIAWDAARLAVFVLRAWIKQRADDNEEFFKRVHNHVWAMMGDPVGPIAAFPLVAPMKSQPDFNAWRSSVLTTDNSASGALTFLWHLRALLTGNESPNFLEGSYFFPVSGAPQSGSPPTLADASGPYPPLTPTDGAWVGLLTAPTEPPGTFTLVLDLQTVAPARACRIPLARYDGAAFTRPTLDASWQDIVQFIVGTGDGGFAIGNEKLTAAVDGPGFRLSLLRVNVAGTGFDGFDGKYDLAIRLENGKPPEFVLGTPVLGVPFPPDIGDVDALVGDLVVWAIRAAAPGNDFGELVRAAATFIKESVIAGNPDELGLLMKVAGVAGQGQQIDIPLGSDASLELEIKNGKVHAGVEFGPIEDESLPIYIGTLKGGVVVNPAVAPFLDGFTLGFENLRLSNADSGSGIVASLIPDMRQFPGFHFLVEYSSSTLTVTGGGKIPIQQTLGPLEIAALLVDVRKNSFAVGLDLGFELGPIAVAAYELGLRFRFDNGAVEPFLHGLGLSMDTGAVKLAGFFAAVEANGVTDYVGGAVVSVAGYFELSAIGGYTQLPDETTSLFIFASLVAPLGGPPWFFITGVAGGFGYNRSLPAPGLLLDHPFLKVMRGEISVGGNAAEDLKGLSIHFVAMKGQHWIAAGIQFTAFGFIYGKVVVAIAFGNSFSITILGMASFGIEPIAYFEIGIEATADEEKFLLRARLSPNSYVIHPDIFSLQGDFALGAWYKEPHKGDFLFSIGGYHPLFEKPGHYPELIRVGCKATVYNFVHLSVEVFFCCTPQALMAGAKASLWGEFAGIAAGLDVYVDVLMKWDPFYLRARLGVHVWFEFFGRHELGVDLDIWTPDFGGIARIDLAIAEFDIEFGAGLAAPPPPPLADFVSKQIGVPAKPWGAGGARSGAFSTEAGAGLFRIEFLKGRPGKEPPSKDEKQEGLSASEPVRLAAEWSFLVRTRLPIGAIDTALAPAPSFSGLVDLPLCEQLDLPATLTVAAPRIGAAGRTWLADYFPAANFGDPVPEAQVGSSAVSDLETDKPSIPLIEGMVVDYAPIIPGATPLTAPDGEPSDPDESYPVPLGAGGSGISLGLIRDPYRFGNAPALTVGFASGVARRTAALNDLKGRTRRPLTVFAMATDLLRFTKLSAGRTFTVTTIGAAGVPVMAPPASPMRPMEMFGVQLRTLPVRSNEPAQHRQMETLTRPKALKRTQLSPKDGVRDAMTATVSVPAGRVSRIEFGGGGPSAGVMRLSGEQTVRVVLLSRSGSVVHDGYERGTAALKVPRGVATALLIGEGMAAAPTTLGVERETILLAAGSRQFLGHGCVVRVLSSFDVNVQALDSLPGAELFDFGTTFRVAFPSPGRDEGTLVLKVSPTVERPGPAAEQVRWLGAGAQFRSLVPVIGAGRVALVMAVRAPAAWSVDVDLGPEWRLDGVVLVPRASRLVVADLDRNANWDLVDDAMPPVRRGLSTSVSVEVKA